MTKVVYQGTLPTEQQHLQIGVRSTASNSSNLWNMRYVGPVHLIDVADFISYIK